MKLFQKINYLISMYKIMLHSYFHFFTCSGYVAYTYHAPVKVHVTATFCTRTTPMYWSRLGRKCYGANTYLTSYSRSEHLFRTRSVTINLVSATMLCYDGKLRTGSVFTHFILLSRTTTSSATGGFEVVPERPSRNEEPTSRNEERTRNVPSSRLVLPQNLFNELLCILPVLEHEILSSLAHWFHFHRE